MSRAIDALEKVGIPQPKQRSRSYPHEFSGGMRQRVMIAMAMMNNPDIIIADEPTTALDVTVQAQILETLMSVKDEFGAAIILITHDLGVVAGTADLVAGCTEVASSSGVPSTRSSRCLACRTRSDCSTRSRRSKARMAT